MFCLTQGVPHTEYYTTKSNTEACAKTEWKNANYLKKKDNMKTTPTEEEQLSAYSLRRLSDNSFALLKSKNCDVTLL